jgi:hypothetical protein
MSMLADAKSRKAVEVRHLRTRSTNERDQKKAELKELTQLLSEVRTEVRTSERVSRDSHHAVTVKLDNVTLETMKAQKQVKELQEQLEICDRNEQKGTPSLMGHLDKIRKGREK